MNSGQNVYNKVNESVAECNGVGSSESTVITIDVDSDSESTELLSQQVNSQRSSAAINMSENNANSSTGGRNGSSGSGRNAPQNLFSLFNTQLGRQLSHPSELLRQQQQQRHLETTPNSIGSGEYRDDSGHQYIPPHIRNIRSWRMNLNDVFSLTTAPSAEALRSLIHSSNFRYVPLSTNDNAALSPRTAPAAGENAHNLLNSENNGAGTSASSALRLNTRMTRSVSMRDSFAQHTGGASGVGSLLHSAPIIPSPNDNNIRGSEHVLQQARLLTSTTMHPNSSSAGIRSTAGDGSNLGVQNGEEDEGREVGGAGVGGVADVGGNDPPDPDVEDENNAISDVVVKLLTQFVRYLPFICILFVKFIHDHLVGILDLFVLHAVMYQMNRSMREEVSKLSQKSLLILSRDFMVTIIVIAYRLILAASTPDPFGLLTPPPTDVVSVEVKMSNQPLSENLKAFVHEKPVSIKELSSYLSNVASDHGIEHNENINDMLNVNKTVSLGILLYYVAVNDLILKLLTILVKQCVTMLPTRVIRHKPRARLFVMLEYISQFYRALVPIHQWLRFLFLSYSGLEVISGVLFSSFYLGAKAFELVERGKLLKKAIVTFIRNMDYERKPTKDEVDAAGALCPICHDNFNSPIILECGHIFCDDCVNLWFKREQTCPMCRAKVSDDPNWKDGSTSFFYQLC